MVVRMKPLHQIPPLFLLSSFPQPDHTLPDLQKYPQTMTLISDFETAILVPLVGPKCAATLSALNFTTDQCATLLLSKILGYAIIVNAAIQKLPQLLKIYNAGNAAGVSLAGYLLETAAFAISLAYNYRSGNPISTYGERKLEELPVTTETRADYTFQKWPSSQPLTC